MKKLIIINDRFAGYPFFYFSNHKVFLGGISFRDLVVSSRKYGAKNLNINGIFQFIWLRKLLSHNTLLDDISYLEGGKILEIDEKK